MKIFKILLKEIWLTVISPISALKRGSQFLNEDIFKELLKEQVEEKNLIRDKKKHYYISYQNIVKTYLRLESFRKKDSGKYSLCFNIIALLIFAILIGLIRHSPTHSVFDTLFVSILGSLVFGGVFIGIVALLYKRFYLSRISKIKKDILMPRCFSESGLLLDDCFHYFQYTLQNLDKYSNVHQIENLKRIPRIHNIQEDIYKNKKKYECNEEVLGFFIKEGTVNIEQTMRNFPFKESLIELHNKNIMNIIYFLNVVIEGKQDAVDRNEKD